MHWSDAYLCESFFARLEHYDWERPHQGRWCYAKVPMQTFFNNVPLAKEMMLSPTECRLS